MYVGGNRSPGGNLRCQRESPTLSHEEVGSIEPTTSEVTGADVNFEHRSYHCATLTALSPHHNYWQKAVAISHGSEFLMGSPCGGWKWMNPSLTADLWEWPWPSPVFPEWENEIISSAFSEIFLSPRIVWGSTFNVISHHLSRPTIRQIRVETRRKTGPSYPLETSAWFGAENSTGCVLWRYFLSIIG
jgi:hypothetical protein